MSGARGVMRSWTHTTTTRPHVSPEVREPHAIMVAGIWSSMRQVEAACALFGKNLIYYFPRSQMSWTSPHGGRQMYSSLTGKVAPIRLVFCGGGSSPREHTASGCPERLRGRLSVCRQETHIPKHREALRTARIRIHSDGLRVHRSLGSQCSCNSKTPVQGDCGKVG